MAPLKTYFDDKEKACHIRTAKSSIPARNTEPMSTARFTTCPKIFPACCTTETDASVSPENATGNWFRWASFTSLPEAPFIRSISETALLRSRAITSAKSGGSAPDTGQENPEDRVDDAQLHGFRNRACTPEMDKPYIPFFSIRIFPIGNICLSSSLLTIITERYGKEAEGQPSAPSMNLQLSWKR